MYILLSMIFMHILDDFCLQGILASMKQASWWKSQESYSDMYKHDYIVALLAHSFSWTFTTMIPVVIALSGDMKSSFYTAFLANMIIHALVDDAKANKRQISLAQDQAVHLAQIVCTFLILV